MKKNIRLTFFIIRFFVILHVLGTVFHRGSMGAYMCAKLKIVAIETYTTDSKSAKIMRVTHVSGMNGFHNEWNPQKTILVFCFYSMNLINHRGT